MKKNVLFIVAILALATTACSNSKKAQLEKEAALEAQKMDSISQVLAEEQAELESTAVELDSLLSEIE